MLPFIDTLIAGGKLAKPLFSLRFPRLGDPNAIAGILSLGEIEAEYAVKPIKYSDVVQLSSWVPPKSPLIYTNTHNSQQVRR